MHQKRVPDTFLILVDNPKEPLHARNFFKKRYFERELSKSLNKVVLFFLSKPDPFDAQVYEKQKEPGSSDQSLFRLQNKFRNIPLLVMHYVTKFHDLI